MVLARSPHVVGELSREELRFARMDADHLAYPGVGVEAFGASLIIELVTDAQRISGCIEHLRPGELVGQGRPGNLVRHDVDGPQPV